MALSKWRMLSRTDLLLIGVTAVAFGADATAEYRWHSEIARFTVSALTIAVLAALVGRSVDHLGDRLGSGATGFLQSALANLPELFIGIFALRAGLVGVVQSALIGSILANTVLVLGISFIAGGLRNGPQHFSTAAPRTTLMLLVLSAAIIMIPTLSSHLGTSGGHHVVAMSNIAAVIALLVFLLSIPGSLSHKGEGAPGLLAGPCWSISLVMLVLSATSVAALFASDWFIASLTQAMHSLNIAPNFAGLVIVAIAGSAIENFVGVKLALENRPDYSLAVILQSPVQIALGLIPALVLLSNVIGPHPLTLVLPTMLFAVFALAVVVAVVIVFDGESTWLEGVALVGLYLVIATAYWWN